MTLAGKRIVVTRAPHQADALGALLRERGAEPLLYPCIDIAPPEDTAPLDVALRDTTAGGFDWVVFTSANTVRMVAARLAALGISGIGNGQIAAIGPRTAAAIQEQLGVEVALMPDEYVAEALAEALTLAPGARVLLPQSAIARPVLRDALKKAGAEVVDVVVYRTVLGSGGVDMPALLARGAVDAVTFTSSSTVRHFIKRLHAEGGTIDAMTGVCVACIGPVTARTAEEAGLPAAVVPNDYTIAGLVDALAFYFANDPNESEKI